LEPEGAAAALFVMGALGLTRMMQEGSGRPAVGDGARQEVTLGSGGGLGARPPAGAWAGAACRRRRRDALLRFYSWVAAALREDEIARHQGRALEREIWEKIILGISEQGVYL